jgi:hypothetical protein
MGVVGDGGVVWLLVSGAVEKVQGLWREPRDGKCAYIYVCGVHWLELLGWKLAQKSEIDKGRVTTCHRSQSR